MGRCVVEEAAGDGVGDGSSDAPAGGVPGPTSLLGVALGPGAPSPPGRLRMKGGGPGVQDSNDGDPEGVSVTPTG